MEEATNLAVRATNGTTLSALSTSLNAGNGLFGGGGAAALGLGIGGGGGNAKLSRERRHRMRELATQKLSEAYILDEIATSVATMQSASSLEDVAKLVLQRNNNDTDAKYVHFFHEKIPSRMLSQCTSLVPLDEVVQERPMDGAPLRTRAVTRMFKNDLAGAVKDLTEALTLCRRLNPEHERGRGQLQLANKEGGPERQHDNSGRPGYETNMEHTDPTTSLEPQLLFHRAGVYLTQACQHIDAALDGLRSKGEPRTETSIGSTEASEATKDPENNAVKLRDDARKLVKFYAKRALRDYIGFLSSLDYTPGLPPEFAREFLEKVNATANGRSRTLPLHSSRLLEMSGKFSLSNETLSDSATKTEMKREGNHYDCTNNFKLDAYQSMPIPTVYPVANLFSSSPPDRIPPYPITSQVMAPKWQVGSTTTNEMSKRFLADPIYHEAVTYHPLLTDALHSVLLCHSLMQTSVKEHLRHAYMVARLARTCDGYPIFLAARSPSRADWIEIIRCANNWIGLQQPWEVLCAPTPLPGQTTPPKKETSEEAKERHRQEAIMEALADVQVHDDLSFRAAVTAREKLAECILEEQRPSIDRPKRWAQSDGKEYPISTERAEAIARWVREAPFGVEVGRTSKRTRKRTQASQLSDWTEPETISVSPNDGSIATVPC